MLAKNNQVSESALIPIITKNKHIIAPQSQQSSVEVDSGYGIADIVFYSLDQESINIRQSKSISRVKSYEILETLSLLSLFDKRNISVTQLYDKLPYSEQFFKSKLLPFLTKHDICSFQARNSIKCLWKYRIAIKETVAIEAKISNWKRGLYQAYRYRQYADYSYLALEAKHINPAWKNIDQFKRANVGLIKVDAQGNNIDILFTPEQETKMCNRMLQMYTNEYILQENHFID